MTALESWLEKTLEPLQPLEKMHHAASNPDAGSQARALLLNLIAGHGFVTRERAGIEHLPKEMRPFLRKIGVTFGALDIFAPALLKPAPRQLLNALGVDRRPLQDAMLPVIADTKKLPSGYRHAGTQAIRIDLGEKSRARRMKPVPRPRPRIGVASSCSISRCPSRSGWRKAISRVCSAMPVSGFRRHGRYPKANSGRRVPISGNGDPRAASRSARSRRSHAKATPLPRLRIWSADGQPQVRIDRLLCYLRFGTQRRTPAGRGHIRRNGEPLFARCGGGRCPDPAAW